MVAGRRLNMRIREPVVAGKFYDADKERCLRTIKTLLAELPENRSIDPPPVAGLVPHAGWSCSGAVALEVFQTIARSHRPETIVLFGGVHRYRGREAAMFGAGRWETPIGNAEVDSRLAERILGHTNLIVDDPYAHEDEHSLEVQIPFLVHLFPKSKIVPIMVPPNPRAVEVGQAVGRTLTSYEYEAVVIGTTDLTHYGPGYGFSPCGAGKEAHRWAKEENDRRFIDLVCQMQAAELVPEAMKHRNACNAGAAAAAIAAAEALGATQGLLLRHCTSSEVLYGGEGRGEDFVGYAGIIFH